MDEVTQTLRRCLRQHLRLSPDREIDLSSDLVSLGLDSMSAIALLLELEQAFAITFPKRMLDPRTFRTGETLLAAVRELVGVEPGASSSAAPPPR